MNPHRPVGILVSVMLVTLLGTIGIAMPYPILAPLFMSDVNPGLTSFAGIHPKLLLGGVLALYPFGLLLGGAFLGSVSDRHGRRKVMLFSLVVSAAGYGFSAWSLIAGSYPLFALSRLVTGISEGNISIARAIAADLHPHVDRKRSLGMLYAASYLGWLIGPLLGGFLMPLGAEVAFLVAGGSVGLALVMVAVTLPMDPPPLSSGSMPSVWADSSAVLLRRAEVRAFFYVHMAFCLGLSAFYEFYPLWLVESFHYDSKAIAFATMALTACMITSSALLSAPATERLGLRRTLVLGASAMGILVACTVAIPAPGVLLLFAILGVIIAITNNAFPTLAAEEFGHLGQGKVMGLLAATWCSSATVLALAGSVLSLGRATYALAFGAACLLSVPLLSWHTRRRGLVLASLLLLGGSSPAASRVTVIDYDFTRPRDEAALDPRLLGDQATAHGFTRGWKEFEPEGVWMLGDRAVFDFVAEGFACEVRLRVATNEMIASRGQTLEIALNGRRLEAVPVGDWNQAQDVRCLVPDEALRRGWNRLELVASTHEDGVVPGQRRRSPAYAVFFQRISIELTATPAQVESMRSRYAGSSDPPPWRWTFVEPMAGPGAARPDVLILLLDAARRDHFGCYGYPRDTTPFIDSLAREGLKFERVFTDVPFTRGAVPTLLTGHSWVHHRVTGHASALGESLPTLAERLGAAGYFTLGVSHNPNASVAAGTPRGFEEFVEVWKLPGPRKRGMEAPARFLLERLETGLPDRPAFCYLHVVPPHAPYRPRPEDDLWSDPHYDGILENAGGDLTLLDRGLLPWTETDRQQVLDLYDGNLRRGDALVESVLAAWSRLRPGRELLTVIVSDHGEAFAEHGRFLHSTTLYDEMTAIPLIFHPASACTSLAGSTAKLRSIADVMPMLLQTLGLGWDGPSYLPEAFARLLENPLWERPYVVMRANTLFGVRTDRHLAFLDRWGDRGLFDLATDPRATRNLLEDRADLFDRLMRRVRQTETELPAVTVEPGPPPPLDLEALKALGYVDP